MDKSYSLFFLDSGKVKDARSIKEANDARDCFRILKDENLFTNEDVIFTQYLLKTIGSHELYQKCAEYAKAQRALCFYETLTGNTRKYVLKRIELSHILESNT